MLHVFRQFDASQKANEPTNDGLECGANDGEDVLVVNDVVGQE
jgi:hypothetical protein